MCAQCIQEFPSKNKLSWVTATGSFNIFRLYPRRNFTSVETFQRECHDFRHSEDRLMHNRSKYLLKSACLHCWSWPTPGRAKVEKMLLFLFCTYTHPHPHPHRGVKLVPVGAVVSLIKQDPSPVPGLRTSQDVGVTDWRKHSLTPHPHTHTHR